ncbi:hypothetical protein KC19_2G172200 [Ceratodon purpureus]|uniref:Uncharacterized protein n=1 Tax=Ceratodon purpureus TaxID=3225 RepID=A0A8T0IWE6_CERPU|nr:hypothetical protein KC19_2G172200 [Ceratodon purpureus]
MWFLHFFIKPCRITRIHLDLILTSLVSVPPQTVSSQERWSSEVALELRNISSKSL